MDPYSEPEILATLACSKCYVIKLALVITQTYFRFHACMLHVGHFFECADNTKGFKHPVSKSRY